MKKIILTMILTSLVFSGFSFALDIDLDDNIDPISLDMLYRSGIISLEEKEAYIDNNVQVESDTFKEQFNTGEVEPDAYEVSQIDEFLIKKISQVGESTIKIDFTQELNDRALAKVYYEIYEDEKKVFNYMDFEIRVVQSDKKSIVLKLNKEVFKLSSKYQLRVSSSLTSAYDLKISPYSKYSYEFLTSEVNLKNLEVLSYEAYKDGFIDIKFKNEVESRFIDNKSKYIFTFNGNKFMYSAKSVYLLEDDDGIARTARVHFNSFDQKYDYKLDLSKFNIANNYFEFPGGVAMSKVFTISDIDLIDNYTIDVTLNTAIDYRSKLGQVRIKSGALVDNFEVNDKHIIIHLKKDAGLSYLSSYSIEFINFLSTDNRKLENLAYTFLTEDREVYEDHILLKPLSAEWVGHNYIQIDFNKPADLKNNANAYIRLRDEYDKSVAIMNVYQLSPYKWIIKTKSGSYGSKYVVNIDKLPEKGNQFRSDKESITIMN
ncbi:MAG: hypothetical protein WBA54_04760 [Acidaminobacteraceae bacterium]